MASDPAVVIGAITWFLAHPAETLGHFPDSAFPIDKTGVDWLLQNGVAMAELHELGNGAIQRGYCERGVQQKQLLPGSPSVPAFPALGADWREIDGTVPFSAHDQSNRFTRGPRWRDNSCALDCIIVAALMLDAGRCQVDQLSTEQMRQLGPLPCALLMIIRKPWSELQVAEITVLRDSLREMMALHAPDRFPRGKHCGVLTVAEELLAGLPQLHATWTNLYSCCEDTPVRLYHHLRTGEIETSACLGLPTMRDLDVTRRPTANPETLRDTIVHGFGRRDLTMDQQRKITSCGAPDCRNPFKVPILVDRLPPVLVISELNLDMSGVNPVGLFDPVWVQCLDTSHTMIKHLRYKLVGYIAQINENHFILVWEKPRKEYMQAISYDGLMDHGKFVDAPSLQASFPSGARLALAFLRIMESNGGP